MKRWLTFILLLITIAGTFFPCCLVDECSEEEVATAPAQNGQDKKEGNCSPFFACATCPGFVGLLKPIRISQPVSEKQIHYPQHLQLNLTTYAAAFWQPPRLCQKMS